MFLAAMKDEPKVFWEISSARRGGALVTTVATHTGSVFAASPWAGSPCSCSLHTDCVLGFFKVKISNHACISDLNTLRHPHIADRIEPIRRRDENKHFGGVYGGVGWCSSRALALPIPSWRFKEINLTSLCLSSSA